MSGLLANSPAEVVQNALVALGLAVYPYLPSTTQPLVDWMVYAANEPNEPDNCLTVYDTTGMIDAKTQPDSEVVQHEGIQLRVRSKDHPTGWVKANTLAIALVSQVNMMIVPVAGGSNRYLLQAVNQTSPVLALGREEESERRLYTINFTVALRQLPYGPIA